jgi:hypothetical protein
LIADALKYLVSLGQKSAEIKTVQLPGGRRLTAWGEDTEICPDDPEPINDVLTTMADLEQWLIDYATDEGAPVVFVGANRITALCHREREHEKLSCKVPLEHSKAWHSVLKLLGGMKHREFVRELRGPLNGAVDPKYLPIFRNLDFARASSVARGVTNTGEKLGRSVESLAQSASGEIPDQLQVTLPVYRLDAISNQVVRCGVEIDPDNETIRFIPVGDDLEEAIDMARRQIVAWINQHKPASVTVFSGEPV